VVKDGRPLADLAQLRRRHLGFVFQKANLTSFLTARENVEIACEFGGKTDGRRRARELLDYLEVAHREHAYPEMLSGGEQQRVAIARALANEPSLILADEPTAALDSVRSRSVMELFRKVAHDRGAAVLVVTHDHRALDVFDVLYEMEDGRIRPDPLHRSDRRSPDASLQYRTELPSHGLRRSMGRRGKSWKNVMAKSFFSSLKTEHIPAQAPPGAAAQAAINESIDGYYNLSTRHSQNGHLSPSSSSRRDRPRDTRQNT
jgi:ABC-type lipoprotein export system ATPase subunit